MIVVILIISKRARNNAATGSVMIAGHAITIFSVILICLITFITLLIYLPDLFHFGNTKEALTQAPANVVLDKTHGLMFILFVNAVLGTFSAGSFTTIILSYTAKREQRGDKAEI
jgi:hypothetical protein